MSKHAVTIERDQFENGAGSDYIGLFHHVYE